MKIELVTTLKRKATRIIFAGAKSRDPLEAVNERLAVLEIIGRGERAIAEGRVVSHQEAKKRMTRWLK
jgi:hypothetical protein